MWSVVAIYLYLSIYIRELASQVQSAWLWSQQHRWWRKHHRMSCPAVPLQGRIRGLGLFAGSSKRSRCVGRDPPAFACQAELGASATKSVLICWIAMLHNKESISRFLLWHCFAGCFLQLKLVRQDSFKNFTVTKFEFLGPWACCLEVFWQQWYGQEKNHRDAVCTKLGTHHDGSSVSRALEVSLLPLVPSWGHPAQLDWCSAALVCRDLFEARWDFALL